MPRRVVVGMIVGLLAMACERRDRLAPDSTSAAPLATEPERTAYLSVSDLSPDSGATIIVAGNVAVGESISLGSFRVRLAYDTASLAYLDEVAVPGMLRVVNPRPGEVIVVGASSDASTDGRLFTLRFRVADPRGLAALSLAVDELNDGAFTSQVRTVRRSSRLLLDRDLVRGRVAPR